MNQTLIKNVNIWTMDEEDTRFYGWVLLENGKIASMGEGEPPAMPVQIDGDVVYGEGGVLTPGLIDIHSHIGLYEDGLGFEGADGNEDTDPATPHLRALDGVNPFDRSFREALEAGVTAAAVSPGSANPIGGQIALLKTAGRRVDDMILKAPLAIKFALGENPKSVYHDKDETPVTRMATAGIIREELYKAKEYFLRKARAEDDPEQDEPDFDIKMEALQPLLWGKAEAHFHAHRADDIFTALRIAEGVRSAGGYHSRHGGAPCSRPAGRGARSGGQRPVHDRPFQAGDPQSVRCRARTAVQGRNRNRHYGRSPGNSAAAAADGAYAGGACGYG